MEIWTQAIVEWINCLGICEQSISHIIQLKDNFFYFKLIEELTNGDGQFSSDDGIEVFKFIKYQYPEIIFTNNDNFDDELKQVYLASLLLLSASQKVTFHRPMYTLKNETQILIKRFLELILPYGPNVTLDIIQDTIVELNDIMPKSPLQTPKKCTLKNFLTSPAGHSAYRHKLMNERTRELRMLKAQLETERFEKADLQEDLKTLENKIQSLQEKLESKIKELKSLRVEQAQPATPKSTRKNKNNGNIVECSRKEVEHLELFNSKLRGDLDRLESENESLVRRSTSKDRVIDALRQKVDEYEQNSETLAVQLEMKTNELLDLRMQNEELRVHIKGIQRYSIDAEQSFEVEHVSHAQLLTTELNDSEAASSIIDIQLRESYEESARLKSELNVLQQKLNVAFEEYDALKRHNESLGEKVEILNEVQMTLEITEDKLSKRDCQLSIMEMEKQSLQYELKKLQDILRDREVVVKNMESRKCELELEICQLKEELNEKKDKAVSLEESLCQIVLINDEMSINMVSIKKEIENLEKSLATKTAECIKITQTSEDNIRELEKNILICSNEKQQLENDLLQKHHAFEQMINDKDSEIQLLRLDVSQLQDQLSLSQSVLSETKIKLCELNELRDELQSQLVQERENAATLFTKKCQLENRLSKVEATNTELSDNSSALQFNFNKLQQEYDDLNEKFKLNQDNYEEEKRKANSLCSIKESLSNEVQNMSSKILELENVRENLENRLTQMQESYMKLITEKSDQEHTILMNERQNNNHLEKISSLRAIVGKYRLELEHLQEKHNDCNINYTKADNRIQNLLTTIEKTTSECQVLKENLSKLEQTEEKLKNELKMTEESVEILSAEKITLEIALSTRDCDEEKQATKITTLLAELDAFHKDIENLSTNYLDLKQKYEDSTQKIISLQNELEILNDKYQKMTLKCNSLTDEVGIMTNTLNTREAKSKEMQLEIDKLRQNKERIMSSHQDYQNASNELIQSLEKKLLFTQSTCETLDLAVKSHEESNSALQLKLEQISNEKIDSESKLKEVIASLQEAQSSQEAVLKAQIEALNDKISEFDIFEKRQLKIKEDMQTEIDIQKTRNVELSKQYTALEETIQRNNQMIQELEKTKEVEYCRLQKLQEEFDLVKADIKTIEGICETFIYGALQQDTADLKQLLKHDTTKNLAEKLENVQVKIGKTNVQLIHLQEMTDKLKKSNDESEKARLTLLEKEQKDTNLLNQLGSIKIEWEKRSMFMTNLVQKKEGLQVLLEKTIASRNELGSRLSNLRASWNALSDEVKNNIATNNSPCDELKDMEAKRMEIEQLLNNLDDYYSKNFKSLLEVLCRIVVHSKKKINELCTIPLTKTTMEISEIDFSDEASVLQSAIETNKTMSEDLNIIQEKIDQLRSISNSYKLNIKSSIVKHEVSESEKVQLLLEKVIKEKKELREKMDAVRVRNAKMEKNMDELRNENKKLKAELCEMSSKDTELERLTAEIGQMLKSIELLKKEKKELEKRPKEEDFDSRLKDIHNEYGEKLEKIKQKMKIAYGEQIAKLNNEQETAMAEKVALLQAKMEQQCKKYSEYIAKYKAHISEMSSQFWDVGEKLLAEKQEKETALQRYTELRKKYQHAVCDGNSSIPLGLEHSQMKFMNIDKEYDHDRVNVLSRPSFRSVHVIEEQTTTTRRHSVKSIQAMGNPFSAEDEEGEVFDNVYLADLKDGKFRGIDSAPNFDRMSELRLRNSLCRPHLKSSYAVETHFHPLGLTEEDIKSGPLNEDTFNDSLSQSLLPGQKMKKKDRTQTSYKRPGPPTPSKNGGRLSLQGNEFKSPTSRILRERNSERRTTSTPKRLKDFFGSTLSRRQDENASVTPKGRRLSNIFRKTRADKN